MESQIKKHDLFFVVLVFLVCFMPFASSLDTLKPAKINIEYTILQTCSNCTYINMSVSNVDGVVLSNVNMTPNGSGVWYWKYTPTSMGRYDVTGVGDIDGVDTSFATYFMVTPNGEEVSVGQSMLYVVFIFIVFLVICLLFYFVLVIPGGNERDENGNFVGIIKMKYLRVFFIAFIYGLIIVLLNLLNGLAVNFVTLTMFAGVIGNLFQIMIRVSWVFTIILVLWLLYMMVHDSNLKKEIRSIERLGSRGI
jgi:hypothetical protein